MMTKNEMESALKTAIIDGLRLEDVAVEDIDSSAPLFGDSGLMLDSLDGKCPFTPEQVKSRLDSVKEAMTSLTASIESLETRLADSDRLTQELKEQHQQLLSWAEMFDTASPAERKLIASHLIKAVTLTRGYGIQIDFNISEAQYLNGMEL